MKLTDIKSGDRLDRVVLLLKSATIQKTKNGKDFLLAELTDGENAVQAKFWDWDAAQEAPKAGSVFAFSGRADEYQGTPQIVLSAIAPAPPGEDDPTAFLPRAPRPTNEMLDDIRRAVKDIKDENVRRVVIKLVADGIERHALASAPASQKLHHAEIGGLLHHVTDILRVVRALAEIYPWLDSDLLIAGAIIHDIGKLRELSLAASGLAEEYSVEGRLVGHIVLGAEALRAAAAETCAAGEKIMLLEHIILSHHGSREFGSPVIPQISEALALNMADMLDAKLFQVFDSLRAAKPGSFSEKIWTLDNRQMYKPR